MYHRERICFLSTLNCNKKEEEKITKPLILGSSAHFNQPGNFGLVSPFQSTRKLWARQPISINQATLNNTWPGTCFFYLPQQLAPPSSPKPRINEPTHPSTPFGHVALVRGLWPQCGQLETTWAITLKSGSSMMLLQFLNLHGCGENCIRKFSRHTPLHTPGAWWPRCAASGLSMDTWRLPRPSH